jgi:hypothetical protein
MKFIEVILQNSDLNQAKLYGPSHKCLDKPDTGITIQHKGAYNVIKDCAYVTTKYLPHFIFGAYTNPLAALKGKFSKLDIEEFVKKSRDDTSLHQLLLIVLDKCSTISVKKEVDFNKEETDFQSLDPYDFYGSGNVQNVEEVNTTLSDVEILCLAFEAK